MSATLTPTSELLADLEYSYSNQQLTATLRDGSRHRYYAVPSTQWRSLRRAAAAGRSVGAYFNRHVRDKYRHRKLAAAS